jgi:spermidine dehydrogenase
MTDESKVTRRDFVNGALVGAGASLLSMSAPGTMRVASAQTLPATLNNLGPDWTGPGGIGDYAHSHGNTHDVVNRAHSAIRNRAFDGRLRSAKNTGEKPDLVVVGCGISGLSACWNYKLAKPDAHVLMLDDHAIFGGHAKQNDVEVDGYRLTAPQASTGIPIPIARAKAVGLYTDYMERLHFPEEFVLQKPTGLSKNIRVPEDVYTPMQVGWERADTGFYYEGKGWVKNPWNTGFRDAPISDAGKRALLQLQTFRVPPRPDGWERWLDGMTYEKFLTDVVRIEPAAMPEVLQYLTPISSSMGLGLGPDVFSAYAAYSLIQPGTLAYWRDANDGVDPTEGLYLATWPGGHSGTARHFLKKILPNALEGEYTTNDILDGQVRWDQLDRNDSQVRMRLSSTTVSVRHDGDPESGKGVIVIYLKDGALYEVHAKAAILCTPQHVNRNICPDLSPRYHTAMGKFHHAPMHIVNVAVRNWKFLENLGIGSARWFDGYGWWLSLRRNLELPGRTAQPLDPSKPTMLTLYNPLPQPGVPFPQQCTVARMKLFAMTYAQLEAAVREQFTKLFGDYGFNADRDIAAIISNRWGHAYAVCPPGHFFGKDGEPSPLEVMQTRFGRIAFGHSELKGLQGWDGASEQGERAAREIAAVT